MAKIKGVILDVDGTLVDSNDSHTQAWIQAFGEFGFKPSYEEVRHLIGMGSDKMLPTITGYTKESVTGKLISQRWDEIFKEQFLPRLRPFDGNRELLQKMKNEGLKLVIASSAKEDQLEVLLEVAKVKDLIQEKTSSDEAKNSKPDPDIIEIALKKIGVTAEEAIMIGDTPYDIEAARKLEIGTIAFRSGGWEDSELGGAIAIYNDAADLLAHYHDSPLAGD